VCYKFDLLIHPCDQLKLGEVKNKNFFPTCFIEQDYRLMSCLYVLNFLYIVLANLVYLVTMAIIATEKGSVFPILYTMHY